MLSPRAANGIIFLLIMYFRFPPLTVVRHLTVVNSIPYQDIKKIHSEYICNKLTRSPANKSTGLVNFLDGSWICLSQGIGFLNDSECKFEAA